ncbi:MAG TPA: hypothetical protein VF338_04020 [Leptolinea sp.]
MIHKFALGLLVVLIGSGMSMGISANIQHQIDNPPLPSDQIQYSGDFKWDTTTQPTSGPRLSMDAIASMAQNFSAQYKTGIEIVQIIETTKYFYISFRETASGVGAFELLANPVTGQMGIENGPSQFWNTKYGVWGSGKSITNGISSAQAQNIAFQYLKSNDPLVNLDPEPIAFYGYYSFTERLGDKITGVLSVNGYSGEVEPHTWLGNILQTKDFTKKQ